MLFLAENKKHTGNNVAMLTNGFLHLISESCTFGEVQNVPVGHINNYA